MILVNDKSSRVLKLRNQMIAKEISESESNDDVADEM